MDLGALLGVSEMRLSSYLALYCVSKSIAMTRTESDAKASAFQGVKKDRERVDRELGAVLMSNATEDNLISKATAVLFSSQRATVMSADGWSDGPPPPLTRTRSLEDFESASVIFGQADEDGDGVLTKKEFRQFTSTQDETTNFLFRDTDDMWREMGSDG